MFYIQVATEDIHYSYICTIHPRAVCGTATRWMRHNFIRSRINASYRRRSSAYGTIPHPP